MVPLLPVPAVAASACADAALMEVVQLTTMHVEVEADRKSYRVGDVAQILVQVSRPAHEDPLGQDVPVDPPMSQPADNVNVGIGVQVERVYLFGVGRTDDEGRALIKVRIPPYTPVGKAYVRALAWSTVVDTVCLTVEEYGYTQEPGLFAVTR